MLACVRVFFTLNKCPKWPYLCVERQFFNTFLMCGLQLSPRDLCSAWLHNIQRYDFRTVVESSLLNTMQRCTCDFRCVCTGSWSLFRLVSEVDLFYDFLCTKQICSISGHLLNLPTNYIHVIIVQQWLQNTQKFTFDSMHAWVTAFFTSNKRLRRPFLWVQIHVSGHSLNLASKYIHVICVQQWLQNT